MLTRYVIKHPSGALYSDCAIVRREKSAAVDSSGKDIVVTAEIIAPRFDAHKPSDASKFDTPEDAESMMAHPHLGDPAAFDGCTVIGVEA